jgi:hypothetical protein
MTTLVALATKDALVMGCDSLASVTRNLIDPMALVEYFDGNQNWTLKMDKNGQPLLNDWYKLYAKAEVIPYSNMTHVTKIFSLSPLPIGILTTGIASIGQRTVKSLINEFKSGNTFSYKKGGYRPIKAISSQLLKFLWNHYCAEFSNASNRPVLEFVIGGYNSKSPIPVIYRIKVNENKVEDTISDFGIVFGGQMDEIQRIVFGTNGFNKLRIVERSGFILEKYHQILLQYLKDQQINIDLPDPSKFIPELGFFNDGWDLLGFNANWGDFSEQNAIECVDFFINIMIKSQQFSSRMPTVGGEVHIGLVTKVDGFRYVSREELSHAGHAIQLEEG